MARHSWKELGSRITGVSVPGVGGVSWVAAPNEPKIAEEVITYLEDQGIFSSPFEWEHPKETYASAGAVRTELTKYMQRLDRNMKSFEHFYSIRKELKQFQRDLRAERLSGLESKGEMTNEQRATYNMRLVKLRNEVSYRAALVAIACKFSLSEELHHWLPPKQPT